MWAGCGVSHMDSGNQCVWHFCVKSEGFMMVGSGPMFSPGTCGQGRALETVLENEKEVVTEDISSLTEKLERQ